MRVLRSYRRLLWASLLGLALMIGIGEAAFGTPDKEIYPFYSWFLFSIVPTGVTYQVYLHRVEGRDVAPPRPYNQADGLVARPHSEVGYKMIQHLGEACARRDAAGISRRREQFEASLPGGTRYEVVRIRTDLVAQWEGRARPEMKSLASFETPEVSQVTALP